MTQCPYHAQQSARFPVIMPNKMPQVKMRQTHVLEINPGYCPVSGEPKEASELRISYNAKNGHIEVMQLRQFIDSFMGGKKYPDGTWIRELEQFPQFVAQHYADLLNTPVEFRAEFRISYGTVILEGVAAPSRSPLSQS